MRKRITAVMLIALIVLSGCSGKNTGPEATVKSFIEAGKSFDFEEMGSFIHTDEADAKDRVEGLLDSSEEEEPDNPYGQYFLEYLKDNASKLEYEIVSSDIDGEEAVVAVEFKYIDGAPVIRAAIGEVFAKILPLAFSGVEPSEEDMDDFFLSAIDHQRQKLGDAFREQTLDIKLLMVEGEWFVSEPEEELLNVFTSNFLAFGDDLDDGLFEWDDEEEEDDEDEIAVVHKYIGEEVVLDAMNLKIVSSEEMEAIELSSEEAKSAREGAKFVVVEAELVNTSKQPFTFVHDLTLVDEQDREYNPTSAWDVFDDALEYRELAPGLKESGRILYEVPQNSMRYSIAVENPQTDEIYYIRIK